MLTLPIKKKWFDMIKSGEKKEEYREIKPYWTSRFKYYLDDWEIGLLDIKFRNGYSKNSPTIKCKVDISKGYGNPNWGVEKDKLYYVLKILSVEEVEE